jgi:hypothetical protein
VVPDAGAAPSLDLAGTGTGGWWPWPVLPVIVVVAGAGAAAFLGYRVAGREPSR